MAAIDDVLVRYGLLKDALKSWRLRAWANPVDPSLIERGVVKRGDTVARAKQRIELAFQQLDARSDHLTIIELCGVFETTFLSWIGSAIGESRRVIDKHYDLAILADLKAKLIRERSSFASLDSLFRFLEGKTEPEVLIELARVRDQRNRSAHGDGLDVPPVVTVEEAHAVLNRILIRFG
jgi:hypothetical protein